MNINWKVRIKNKNFWLALIPALLLLIQAVAYVFGFSLDLSELGDKLLAVVNAIRNGSRTARKNVRMGTRQTAAAPTMTRDSIALSVARREGEECNPDHPSLIAVSRSASTCCAVLHGSFANDSRGHGWSACSMSARN